MQALLPDVLPDLTKARILVIGDVMLDRYWFGDTSRVSPEAPVPIVRVNGIDNRPGGAGNVALNIAALGAKVILLGVVGHDEAANTLSDHLKAATVEHHFVKSQKLSTIVKLRVISRHQQLLRLDFEENSIDVPQEELLNFFQTYLNQVNLVILSDYKKGTLKNPQDFIQLAQAANIPVLIDPKSQDFSIYRYAHLITPNFKEFEAIVGPCTNENEIISKGRELLTQYQIKNLLVTRGEVGMTLIDQKTSTHLPAYAREILDVTGAGDTVISTLGAALSAGSSLLDATTLSNLAASLVVQKLGAASISLPELEFAILKKTHISSGIVNDEQLLKAVNEARALGKKIVFTNGCFDILHAGHVLCLQLAKQLGDYLIVAVNADESIRKAKGKSRPINHLAHRMMVLSGLGVVDWVIPFSEDTPERLLTLLKPDVLVKGGDYQLDKVVGADIVRSYGGEVKVVNSNITSSSDIINRIISRTQKVMNEEEKNYG